MKANVARSVIDSSILIPLLDAGLARHLALVYDEVHIPPEVECEIRRKTHGRRRRKLRNLFEMKTVFLRCTERDVFVFNLLRGTKGLTDADRAVISQAKKIGATAILINDKDAIKYAEKVDLNVERLRTVSQRLSVWQPKRRRRK